MYANRQNFRLSKEIWVKEHDGDVRFLTGSRNTTVRACAVKNMQYNSYLWLNRRNSGFLNEIGVEKNDDDVRFKSRSGNMAVSCIRNASRHNCRNNLVIVDLSMGQIPRSTECISSFKM